jgi:hypothetical protein
MVKHNYTPEEIKKLIVEAKESGKPTGKSLNSSIRVRAPSEGFMSAGRMITHCKCMKNVEDVVN